MGCQRCKLRLETKPSLLPTITTIGTTIRESESLMKSIGGGLLSPFSSFAYSAASKPLEGGESSNKSTKSMLQTTFRHLKTRLEQQSPLPTMDSLLHQCKLTMLMDSQWTSSKCKL